MEKKRKRKERQIAVANDGFGKQRYGEGWGKRTDRERELEVRRQRWELKETTTCWNPSGASWRLGNRGRESNSNAGEERAVSFVCLCVLDYECRCSMKIKPLSVLCVCMFNTSGVSKDKQHVLRQHKYEELSMSQEEKVWRRCPSLKQHERTRLCKQNPKLNKPWKWYFGEKPFTYCCKHMKGRKKERSRNTKLKVKK